jgi:hypothetical protein
MSPGRRGARLERETIPVRITSIENLDAGHRFANLGHVDTRNGQTGPLDRRITDEERWIGLGPS